VRGNKVELFDMQSAPYALQTYYGYVRAWTEKIGQLYGSQSGHGKNLKRHHSK